MPTCAYAALGAHAEQADDENLIKNGGIASDDLADS
jgi:hypothetical protein